MEAGTPQAVRLEDLHVPGQLSGRKHILSILVELIKADLKLSDTQMGMLGGLAFAVFYAGLGIPVALIYAASQLADTSGPTLGPYLLVFIGLPIGMALMAKLLGWLDRIDPGLHRRIKGLRLVTAYGIAALMGAVYDQSHSLLGGASLPNHP